MQDNIVLQRFQKFRAMFVSSNISGSVLLDMVETFITTDNDTQVTEAIPVLEGQISLFDYGI